MLAAANFLRAMNMPEGDVIGGREVLRRKGIQCADIDVTHGITFAGTDGGQVAAGDNRQRAVAAQRTGLLVLVLIVISNGFQ
jgi:hypothetical protein